MKANEIKELKKILKHHNNLILYGIRSNFWIKTRKQSNGLVKTSYQSKRFTSLVINVRTLSQWS